MTYDWNTTKSQVIITFFSTFMLITLEWLDVNSIVNSRLIQLDEYFQLVGQTKFYVERVKIDKRYSAGFLPS